MANDSLIYARFFVHSVLNEAKTKKEGRPIYDDVEQCEVRFAANKQTVHVAPAHEVFRTERNFATGEVTPITYALAYNEQYKKFKAGLDQDQSGTPLAELPFLTAGKRLELKALNIHTAEALAALDGQPLKQLGMGGRDLKTQAQAYLAKAAGTVDFADMTARIAKLEAENERLRSESIVPEGDVEPTESPFAEWEADDIRNWIEANHGEKPRSNATQKTLVKLADALNAELAKKVKAE